MSAPLSGEKADAPPAVPPGEGAGAPPRVRAFDFLRPSKFSRDQLRTLEMLHEGFCRAARNQLSATLRTMVDVTVAGADEVGYGDVVSSMGAPTLVHILSMEPLRGHALLEVDLPMALSFVDRLAGGPGTRRPRPRELTEIEHALMRPVTDALLDGLSEAWSPIATARFSRAGTESNPQFAQIAAPSDTAVVIRFELTSGGESGPVSLCVPYPVLEPAVERLSARSYLSGPTASEPDLRATIASELGGVSVPVAAELGRADLDVRDLLALEAGDIVPLGVPVGAEVAVRVGRRRAFRAHPGTRGRRAAVQVTATGDDSERTVE